MARFRLVIASLGLLLVVLVSGVSLEPRTLPQFFNCYQKRATIGACGQAIVTRSRPCSSDHDVAIKSFSFDDKSAAIAEVAFLNLFADQSTYIGIPRLFDFIAKAGKVHIVMQYFKGRTLKALALCHLTSSQPIEERILVVLFKVIAILNYLHQSRIVHLDVKLSNILMSADLDVMLIDYAGCRCLQTSDLRKIENVSGELVYSPAYTAPEVLRLLRDPNHPAPVVDPELQKSGELIAGVGYCSDIYSVGECCEALFCLFPEAVVRKRLPRLFELFKMATNPDYLQRPTAEELLNHDVFARTHTALGLEDCRDLGSFETLQKLMALKPTNAKFWESYVPPSCDQPKRNRLNKFLQRFLRNHASGLCS